MIKYIFSLVCLLSAEHAYSGKKDHSSADKKHKDVTNKMGKDNRISKDSQEYPTDFDEPDGAETINVRETITIKKGEVLDGTGKIYKWTGSGKLDSNKEGMSPMFILENGASMKNVYAVGSPEGFHCRGNNVVDRLIIPDVGEDGIVIQDGNVTIKNSFFRGAGDKIIQDEPYKDVDVPYKEPVTITGNQFFNAARPIKLGYIKNAVVKNNKFFTVKRALYFGNESKSDTMPVFVIGNNTFDAVDVLAIEKGPVKVIDEGNNTIIQTEHFIIVDKDSIIESRNDKTIEQLSRTSMQNNKE